VADAGRQVDMTAAAVTDRLRGMSRQLEARGFIVKGPDMSPTAITQRLRALGSLSDMCRRLAAVGPRLRKPGKTG
jgi:hypothetical protein